MTQGDEGLGRVMKGDEGSAIFSPLITPHHPSSPFSSLHELRLGVNVDHIATVRQARRGRVPDPVEAALVCERAGAQSIVCHLREDRRHIQDEDVRRLKAAVTTRLNLEMSIAKEIVAIALAVKPAQVTLVPERREELTTEGGLDVVRLQGRLAPLLKTFGAAGIAVSLFIDPDPDQLKAARACGAPMIELHTGRYAEAATQATRRQELRALEEAARLARTLGLGVAAGHGLDDENVQEIIRIPEIEELNIGFSIISRALSVGLEAAVKEMVELIHRHQSRRDALQAA
jgi:pyridoxine 5-phosphate synthase